MSDWFQRNGHEAAVRGLDREALAKLAAEGKTRYGLDPEFSRYMELGAWMAKTKNKTCLDCLH
ncbi:MAG: hypothetical protein LBE17_06655 [Treponema sp.]|nr:hypothetical protein [Treponema sp.]